MFSTSVRVHEEEKKDVFAPVADLMVGVVFIFILMVMALSLLIVNDVVPREQHESMLDSMRKERDQAITVAMAWKERAEQLERDLLEERRNAKQEAERVRRLVEFVSYVRSSPMMRTAQRANQVKASRDALLFEVETSLRQKGVDVVVDTSRGSLRLPADGMFSPGSADPSEEAKRVLREIGTVLASVLPCHAGVVARNCIERKPGAGILSAVYVEGHTDVMGYSSPSARLRNNWDLSAARAIEAYGIMREVSSDLRSLENREGQALFGVSGYAETRPVHLGTSLESRAMLGARAADRRIEIRFVMLLDDESMKDVDTDFETRLAKAIVDARL